MAIKAKSSFAVTVLHNIILEKNLDCWVKVYKTME